MGFQPTANLHWQYPIRILSDLHIGHPMSRLRDTTGLGRLFEGAGTVIFNGDSVEPFLKAGRTVARAHLERLAGHVRAAGAAPFFISGNHDPDETPHTHADALGGLVHITHGDALFDKIVPWALDGEYLANLREEAMNAHPLAGRGSLEAHLQSTRSAVRKLHRNLKERRRRKGALVFFLQRLFWFPRKVMAAPKAWRETPDLARRYLRQFRPHARFIVIGHTHKPGFARAGRRIVLNTGSFQFGPGAACVQLSPHAVELLRVRRVFSEWRLGASLATFRTADHPLLVGHPGSEALS